MATKFSTKCGLISYYMKPVGGELNILSKSIGKDIFIKHLQKTNAEGKNNEIRMLFGHSGLPYITAMVSVGEEATNKTLRDATSTAFKELKRYSVTSIYLDTPESGIKGAIEGGILAHYNYKSIKNNEEDIQIKMYDEYKEDQARLGRIMGHAQNLARYLGDSPANLANPTSISNMVKDMKEKLELENLEVTIHGKDWIEEKGMGAFLSVAAGSAQEPKMLIIEYKGTSNENKPTVLVGKGVTFDSGGISLKPSKKMDSMKADMLGGASIIATITAASAMKAKVNIVGVIPLTENLPSGTATKPGDVVVASNKKTIEIANTDAEGRLILADAIHYAQEQWPDAMWYIDIATLTGAACIALGYPYSAIFSECDDLVNEITKHGKNEDDEFWRLPLGKYYTEAITSTCADVKNISNLNGEGGSSTAAAFIQEFIKEENLKRWAHLDIACTMEIQKSSYMDYGMSGRPVRALLSWLISDSINDLDFQKLDSYVSYKPNL